MKIALVGNTVFHQGAEYAMVALANGLAGKGHVVDVVLSQRQLDLQSAHPEWKGFELGDNVRIIINPHRRGRNSIFSLQRIMRQNGYDVVMSHASPFSPPLVFAAWGLWKKPLLIHVQHSGGTGVNDEGELLSPVRTLGALFHNFIIGQFDGVFGVSSGTSEGVARMTGFPRDRIFTVYNPVVDRIFHEKRKALPVHPWLRNPELPVVVAAGALVSNKRYPMLIEAFSEVLKLKKARLVIFGEGDRRCDCEQAVKRFGVSEFVSLPGFTDNLPAELKGASCFVVSSGVESFSIVCVEALACGVPVVSTNCPYGPPEILKNGKYGILVENKNPHALAEGIVKVLDGNGINPTPDMVAPYTVEAVVDRYEKAINELLQQKKDQKK